MDEASQQPGACSAVPAFAADFGADFGAHDVALPAQSIHFAVPTSATLTWRVIADGTLRVYGARIWVTRARSPYDHWLNPGDVLRVHRGERLWLSADIDDTSTHRAAARVTLTSAWRPPLFSSVAVERLATWFGLFVLRRAR
ncbi:DUF2917 domain-containing protein [Paraburkholderia sp.]|uniref:DUF2917 domain-containing protein n=1 Tax=Paraburkholderia sp. TaxID=1926495 RepID=UPI00286F962A|nr:DUF2917 domain-containing protein [Paraburkholderia sp.]